MLKCPNCGAPLQESGGDVRRTCGYCGALLELPPAAAPSVAPYLVAQTQYRQPPATPRTGRLALLLGVGVISAVSVIMMLLMKPPSPVAAGPAAPRAALPSTPVLAPHAVAWSRLQAIDIHASVERTKATLPAAFPEATVEQDKTYRMDLDHPILTHARYSWEWGCSCLEMVAFDVKDFNTWTRVKDTFLPCVEHGLGPVSSSSPPFDYQWRARADIARVRLAPDGVYLFFERDTSDAAYRKVLNVLDSCRK